MNLVYSQRNRSACVRIPVYSERPEAKRVEFRCPDPSANVYLAFAAMLMAGLDGIERGLDPGDPIDEDLYELPPDRAGLVGRRPGPSRRCSTRSRQDHAFLLAGDVFTPDLIETYIAYKREVEVEGLRLRPHPYEFFLYYDV